MSAHQDQHGHHDHQGHHGHEEGIHASMSEYVKGFVLSVILTAIPFGLVMGKVFANPATTTVVILGFALVQILVHMRYFLHMNAHSEGGWNLLALIFTTVLVVIALSGSLWVMYHLNHNMMPTMQDMHTQP